MKTLQQTLKVRSLASLAILASLAVAPLLHSANLVAHLPFDGNLDDASGNGNNGAAIGSPGFVDDAVSFNGVDTGVTISTNASLDSNISTLAYWINPNGATQSGGFERLTSRGGDSFETAFSTNDELSYFSPGGGWLTIDVPLPNDEWSHVAWVNSGSGALDMELFVNGVSIYEGPGITDGNPSGLLNIGIRHNDVEGYEGLMDDLRLYDGALTSAEVNALIPEPSSSALAILGLLGFCLRRRR